MLNSVAKRFDSLTIYFETDFIVMSEIMDVRLLSDDPPPAYSENPPPYLDTLKGSGSSGEQFAPPTPRQYGSVGEAASICETAQDPTEQPPSYASLFGEIREARRRSHNVASFLKNFLVLLLGTIGCTICLGLILAIPVSMIVIGSYHFNECPKEKMIPIYLIVSGVAGLLKSLINLVKKMKAHIVGDDHSLRESTHETSCDNIITLFLVAWFIAGNVWIYRIYMPTNDECEVHLYMFAFWLTTSTYIVFCLMACCILCAAVCALGSTEPEPISNA